MIFCWSYGQVEWIKRLDFMICTVYVVILELLSYFSDFLTCMWLVN